MTQQDTREQAWREFDRSEGWPKKDSYSFRVGFDKGRDAAKRDDEPRIAALRTVLAAFIPVCSHQDDAYHYDCLKPAHWRTGDPDGCEWSACDEHAESWNPSLSEPWDEDKRVSNALRALAGQKEVTDAG